MNGQTTNDAGVASLLGSLVADTGTLFRQELDLASTEMGHKVKTATGNVGMLLLGGAVVHAGVLALLAAVVIGLGPWVPYWASALAVGVVVAAGGYAIVHRNLKALEEFNAAPDRAIQSIKRDAAWVKEQVR